VSLRTVRGVAAIAGLAPVLVALALGASLGQHRGAWHAPVFHEAWEVDEPPEFLVAPDGLDALPAIAGGKAVLRVSVRVDADGRRVGVAVDAPGLPAEVAARLERVVEHAFADVTFLPARRDGRPVPAVLRWSVGLDPNAPIALGFRLQN
jgi:hypothetical protein